MVALTSRVKFYLYAQATDMRKSFDGLSGVVTTALGRDPTSGDVYVFVNRRRDRMKLLVRDRSGFWLFYNAISVPSTRVRKARASSLARYPRVRSTKALPGRACSPMC